MKNVCLVGNPNCGKTTLFNHLTRSHQKVGNWSGVTVEKKEGEYYKDKSLKIVDLPGLYSLFAQSLDEKVVIDALKTSAVDLIVNVIDGTNLERNLYLTLELVKLNLPMVVAINMADELDKNNIKLDEKKLSDFLGLPVIKISAKNGKGVDNLISQIYRQNHTSKNSALKAIQDSKIYSTIEKNINSFITDTFTCAKVNTLKIDKILTHSFFGSVIFFIVIFLVYFVSLKVGGFFGDLLVSLLNDFSNMVSKTLLNLGVNDASIDLLVNGVIKGIGTVLSFLPHLLIMFFFMTALEESGYTARVSFIFDKLFSKFNLSGKSIIPFILSCGCTVSGIEASKVIQNGTERENTIILSPFLPCGAKMAIFGWFSHLFFNGSVILSVAMYLLSIVVLLIVAKILKIFSKDQSSGGFILELPVLRVPRPYDIFVNLIEKSKEFLVKSGTTIFAISIVVWVLSNFGINGYAYGESQNSFLYYIGEGLKYIFMPLGFGTWQASVSVFSGLLAKEGVVETLQILTSNPQTLFDSTASVYAFLAFNLLCPPCVASISTAKRELKSNAKLLKMIAIELVTSYSVSLIINFVGIIINLQLGLILSIIIGIIILAIFLLCVNNIIRGKRACVCTSCNRNNYGTKNDVRLNERVGKCSRGCVLSRGVGGRKEKV